jgi:predicted RNA-binding Zn-ribbon protein involved in translation (DUF1610 family)
MPNVGDIVPGKQIGLSSSRYVWTQCPDCGEERWVRYRLYDPSPVRRCRSCYIQEAKKGESISVKREE